MAILYSKDRKVIFDLRLYKHKDDFDWLTYEMDYIVRNKSNEVINKVVFNNISANTELYLDCKYDNEVFNFIQGINNVIEGNALDYEFEPTDDRDFLFKVSKGINCFNINVLFKFPESTVNIKFYTLKGMIINFLIDLNNEYNDIINNRYYLLT